MTKTLVAAVTFILCMKSHSLWAQSPQEADLCEKLQAMVERDQKYRGSDDSITTHYTPILDSLILAKGLTKQQFASLPPHEQGPTKEQAFKMAGHRMKPIMANDSLANIQVALDHENTKNLIELVQKHGWLTDKNLGCKQKFKTVLILRHSPKTYWKQVREVIEKERAANRISEYEYEVIDNHLKGRPPMTKKLSDFQNE